ncbi:MAG: hypothetical protein AB7P49_07350 [Bdellovibrionales bacterium]
MPHPLNMIADWQDRENYLCQLPTYNHSTVYDLTRTFEPDATKCRGMIVQYLKGTTGFELDKVKDRLRREHRIQDFRSAANRERRDRAAPRKVNFLHCAFRYRGKANYRDAIFLAYGDADARFDGRFISALHTFARFANLVAFAYLKVRVPGDHWQRFRADIDENLRHIDAVPVERRYWATIG